MKAGFTLEFSDREDGYLGIQKKYRIEFPNVATMEPKLRYGALQRGDINLVDAYSTDSELRQYELVVLEDDQELFPPYQGAPMLRQETADQYPQLVEVLNQLAGKITDDEMRQMNYDVNVEGANPEQVAAEYLKQAGLL
ncbi:Glycine betaine/carnitine/choline-binding protein OpuCC precursor [compost metagenome]